MTPGTKLGLAAHFTASPGSRLRPVMPWYVVVLIIAGSMVIGAGICYLGLMWYLSRSMWQ